MNKTIITDNEAMSKRKVPIMVCIFSMPMLLDSVILWFTFALLLFVHTRLSGDISSFVSGYALLTLIPWIIVHIVSVIGGIIVKIVSKKKWIGSIGIWLCIMSILHVIIRVLPLVILFLCEIGKGV